MKLNKIFNTLSIAAVAFFATACADTDAQYEIPVVGAPEYVSVTPSEDGVLLFGEKTIKVKFDRRVFFVTKNTSQITLKQPMSTLIKVRICEFPQVLLQVLRVIPTIRKSV